VLPQVIITLTIAEGLAETYHYSDMRRAVRKVRTLGKHDAAFTVEIDNREVTPTELEQMAAGR